MKGAIIALFIGITLLVVLYFKSAVYRGKGTIDIHLHDTYFVLSNISVLIFVFLFLGTFFSIGGSIGTRFTSKWFLILLVVFLAIDTYYTVTIYKAFNKVKQNSSLISTSENLNNYNK